MSLDATRPARPADAPDAATESEATTGDASTAAYPSPAASPAPVAPEDDPNIGRRIGAYRIESLLGRGGMGSVYLARREDDFSHRVTIKLVNPEMQRQSIVERFVNERQILANLQHPNIARLLDGGTTEDGLPFFIMEYVEGERIDEYCESRYLSIAQRLKVFLQVCAGVHFAHQNLVVHRDIKPGNILITADGSPKLLDFGIAKILGTPEKGRKKAPRRAGGGRVSAEIGSSQSKTVSGAAPMTPDFASPEQILGDVITTASDVYSLGVLLYGMLSLQQPYSLGNAPYLKMVHTICKSIPPKPSDAVAAWDDNLAVRCLKKKGRRPSAKRRRRLHRRLRGDLDAIVVKAMAKDVRERYNSTQQLAEDVERHLHHWPIRARHNNWAYRFGKFVQRHVLAVALMVLAVVSTIGMAVLWRQAEEARATAEQEGFKAERERSRASKISAFLEDVFSSSNPDVVRGAEVTARELLDQGLATIQEELRDDPEARADILRTLGKVYDQLGAYTTALELKKEVVDIRRQLYPEGHALLAISLNNLAKAYYNIGDYENAEAYYREALEVRDRLGQGEEGTQGTMYNLANLLLNHGKLDEAEDIFLKVREIRVRMTSGEGDNASVGAVWQSLGMTYYSQDKMEEADDALRKALAIFQAVHGPEHTRVASAWSNLGLVLQAQGRLDEAKVALQRSLDLRRQLLGDDHKNTARAKSRLADLLLDMDETAAAGILLLEAHPVLRKTLFEGSWFLAEAESVMGLYLLRTGNRDEAESYLTRSYDVLKKIRGDDDTFTRNARRRLDELRTAAAK